MEEERGKRIAEKIRKLATENYGREFRVAYGLEDALWSCYVTPSWYELEYPVKTQDGRELGTFFMRAELRHIYFDEERRIKWPDDFIDPYPVTVERITFYKNGFMEIYQWKDLDLKLLSEAYYAITFSDFTLKDREDRMKAARLIPAVIKDIEVFLRILKESLERHNIKFDFSKVGTNGLNVSSQDGSSNLKYSFEFLGHVSLTFPTKGMNDDEIVDNVMRRVEALTEYRRKFRKEWLPSEERRNCYESTFLYPEDPFRKSWFYYRLVKWPFKSSSDEINKAYENGIRNELLEHLKYYFGIYYSGGGKISKYSDLYNLDGYNLELVNYKLEGKEIVGGEIKINKRKRIYKFPLEKIEFLKEDFPELWKNNTI